MNEPPAVHGRTPPSLDGVPVNIIERIMLILDILEHSVGGLTLGQISAESHLPRSSAHRIVTKLVDASWIARNDKTYALGLRMFEMGSRVPLTSRLIRCARPLVHHLCETTNQVVHLAVLDQGDVIYVDKVGGRFARTLPSKVGGRLPAHCTALGKALLAASPDVVVDDYVAQGLAQLTSSSISNGRDLKNAVARIRSDGYATDTGESVAGVMCVGAAIFEYGRPVASISVCGPVRGFDVKIIERQLSRTAGDISRQLTRTSHS